MLDDLHAVDFALVGHTHGAGPAAGRRHARWGARRFLPGRREPGRRPERRPAERECRAARRRPDHLRLQNVPDRPNGAAPFAVAASEHRRRDQPQRGPARRPAGLRLPQRRDIWSSGALSTDRYSAYGDLVAEGYLGDAGGDIARNNGVLQPTLYAQRAQSADALTAAALSALDVRYRVAPLAAEPRRLRRSPPPMPAGWARRTARSASRSAPTASRSSPTSTLPASAAQGLPLQRRHLLLRHGQRSSSTLPPPGPIGWDTAITIGADGLPFIANFDDTTYDLTMIHCGNAACSSGNTTIHPRQRRRGRPDPLDHHRHRRPPRRLLPGTPPTMTSRCFHCGTVDCSSGTTLSDRHRRERWRSQFHRHRRQRLPRHLLLGFLQRRISRCFFCGNAACCRRQRRPHGRQQRHRRFVHLAHRRRRRLPRRSPTTTRSNDDLKVLHCGNAGVLRRQHHHHRRQPRRRRHGSPRSPSPPAAFRSSPIST